jgi:hypothetical protein
MENSDNLKDENKMPEDRIKSCGNHSWHLVPGKALDITKDWD